jgi:hypothetical protein
MGGGIDCKKGSCPAVCSDPDVAKRRGYNCQKYFAKRYQNERNVIRQSKGGNLGDFPGCGLV